MTEETVLILPIYEVVEENWARGETEYYITRDGFRLGSTALGGVSNSFKTMEVAIEQLEKMKFRPTKKVVYTDSF